MKVDRIDHISLKIPKVGIDKCLSLYRDTLGFDAYKLDRYRQGERTSFFLDMGGALLNIRPVEDFEKPAEGMDHFCIVFDGEVSGLEDLLIDEGYKIYKKGNPLGSKGRNPAIYVEDPFGYRLEIKESSKQEN